MRLFGKKLTPVEIVVGAGVLGLLVYEGTKLGVAAVNAKYLDFQLSDFVLDSTGGSVVIDINNPTPSSYTIQAITADISINLTRIATASYIGQLVVVPSGTTKLSLRLSLDPAGILQEGYTIAKGLTADNKSGTRDANKQSFEITAVGSAQVDTIMVPINTTLGVVQI